MPALNPRPGLLNIRPHMITPQGGAVRPKICIASNESAFGASPKAYRAAEAAVRDLERYPEEGPDKLAAAIAESQSLDIDRIACGPGSDDLLSRLARAYLRAGDELIHSVNGYQKIPNYAHANDAVPVSAPDRDFTADVDALLAAVTPHTRMVMLANPDNPTGSLVTAEEIRRLRAGLPGGVLLVLDSAYAEYVDRPDYERPDRLVEAFDNIVMTRTFSKIYGLAGARVGWLYGPPAVVDAVKRIGSTFPLSSLSLAAALAALVVSGLPPYPFTVAGFSPPKSGKRRSFFNRFAELGHTLVVFESPHRVLASLDDAIEAFGDREAALGRELTKMHEEVVRGRLSEIRDELAARAAIKGEITLVIGADLPR